MLGSTSTYQAKVIGNSAITVQRLLTVLGAVVVSGHRRDFSSSRLHAVWVEEQVEHRILKAKIDSAVLAWCYR